MIKLNNKEYEFKFSFKALKEFMAKTGVSLSEFQKLGENFNYVALIASLGTGLPEAEIEDILDKGNFNDVKEIFEAFGKEVAQYFPNGESQAQ